MTVFFSGEEALQEVAKPDGLWNWALVGPDPDKLPLSGGGAGSVEEMRHALGAQPCSFGLLRMTFGLAPSGRTKFILVHASNVDDEDAPTFSMLERGRASAKAPQMEKAIQKFAHAQVTVEITNSRDCSVDFIIEKLSKGSQADANILTVEKYQQALGEFHAAHPVSKEEKAQQVEAVKLIENLAPAPVDQEPEHDVHPEQEEEAATKLRSKVRLYKPGDLVVVWSDHTKSWQDDGEVTEVLDEAARHGGQLRNAGSMKVVYSNGRRFKWVDPKSAANTLRASTRPRPPPAKNGELMKETHTLQGLDWHRRYFELSKGFLSCWKCHQDVSHGKPAYGTIPLLGLQLKLEGSKLSFWTAKTQGQLIVLDAGCSKEAMTWALALEEHSNYAASMPELAQAAASHGKPKSKENKEIGTCS